MSSANGANTTIGNITAATTIVTSSTPYTRDSVAYTANTVIIIEASILFDFVIGLT